MHYIYSAQRSIQPSKENREKTIYFYCTVTQFGLLKFLQKRLEHRPRNKAVHCYFTGSTTIWSTTVQPSKIVFHVCKKLAKTYLGSSQTRPWAVQMSFMRQFRRLRGKYLRSLGALTREVHTLIQRRHSTSAVLVCLRGMYK
jgi:hypothetical protein